MSTATIHRLTADEYLALERVAVSKSEFFDGEMIPMSGGSSEHSVIAVNLLSEFRRATRNLGCRVHNSDMRVRTPSGLYTYPDVSLSGDQPQFVPGRRDILLNPVLIAEVLSPSTEAYDRGGKFARYRSIESLQTYLLVSQERPLVEVFTRLPNGDWSLRAFERGSVELFYPTCELEIAEVYYQVDFSLSEHTPEPEDPRSR